MNNDNYLRLLSIAIPASSVEVYFGSVLGLIEEAFDNIRAC
jgi:hypothetical protein